jgi:hypothetical protein
MPTREKGMQTFAKLGAYWWLPTLLLRAAEPSSFQCQRLLGADATLEDSLGQGLAGEAEHVTNIIEHAGCGMCG